MHHPYQILPSGDIPGLLRVNPFRNHLYNHHLYNHLWATAQQEEKTPQRVKGLEV